MDKKEYLKPSMQVVKIGMAKLMSGSSNGDGVTSTVSEASATSAAKSRSWDDGEE